MRVPRRHRWIAWLLPLFILRAFVPVGFMWAPAHDGLQLVLCFGVSGAPVAPPSADAGADGAHHHHPESHAQHDGAGESSHQMSMCPFAAAGVGFIDAAPPPAIASVLNVIRVDAPLAAVVLDRTPVSQNRIRGPPSLV